MQIYMNSLAKIKTLEELEKIVGELKNKRKKIVFTNGAFDILHLGHIIYLEKSKELGDILIVGLNSDDSIKKYKSRDRPINKQEDRAYLLGALESVDYVVIFDNDKPLDLIKRLQPDIKVKGGSYDEERVREEDKAVKSYGGRCIYLPMIEDYSTTSIINKIRNNSR